MHALASFVMRGRMQAVMAATLLAMLGLLVPPIGILASASVALVTLRHGAQHGATVLALATTACGFFGWILLGNPVPVVGFALLLWVPVWILSILLRSTRSLALTVQGAILGGVLIVVFYSLQIGDAAGWQTALQPLADAFVEEQVLDRVQSEALIAALAPWMTGLLAIGFFLQLVLALFVARFWQAALYNPGGFRKEFHELRLYRTLAYLLLPVLAALLAGAGAGFPFLRDVALVLVAAYFLQGLAVAHGVVGKTGMKGAWLLAVYLLLFLLPQVVVLITAATGYADTWVDFRARMGGGVDKT